MNPADQFIREVDAPLAKARVCTICKFTLTRRKAPAGRAALGRGAGFVLGNKQRGEMIQHIKAAHPAEFAAAKAKADAWRAADPATRGALRLALK